MFATQLTIFKRKSDDLHEYKGEMISPLLAETIDKSLAEEVEKTIRTVKRVITTLSAVPGYEDNAEIVDNARRMINASIINQLKSKAKDNRDSITEKLLLRFVVNGLNIQKAGNCKEHALYAYSLLQAAKIKCEVFRIENGDHVFVVVNRDTSTPPHDYMSWNSEAFVLDPFIARAFSPKEIPALLKSGSYDKEKNQITDNNFDPKKHKLDNTVMQKFVVDWQDSLIQAASFTVSSPTSATLSL